MDVLGKRRKRAVLTVAGLMAGIVVACLLSSRANASSSAAGFGVPLSDYVMESARSGDGKQVDGLVEEVVGNADGWRVSQREQLPSWFLVEVFEPDEATDVYVFREGAVVGFLGPQTQEATWPFLRSELEARGWHLMETGTPGTITGVKEGGEVTWLSISCTQVSDETCVVVQVPSHP